jgi:hypothetical protein
METPKNLSERVSWAIEFAWSITIEKIAYGEIKINKEASLQLHYSANLKSVLDLIKFSPTERIEVELETTVKVGAKPYIIDILILYSDGIINEKHSIELKCYKTLSSSGGKRGAGDIFMHGVYTDIYYSEIYLKYNFADHTTCLILTDYKNFIHPKSKKTKNWTYDISDGFILKGGNFDTSIGGKKVDFKVSGTYKFDWTKSGEYWSTILRPE